MRFDDFLIVVCLLFFVCFGFGCCCCFGFFVIRMKNKKVLGLVSAKV